MSNSIPSQYLLVLAALVAERGYPLEGICEGTTLNIKQLGQLGTRVDASQADRVIMNALAITGDSALGLEVGQKLNLGAHAVVGQTFMACSNLAEALDSLVRYDLLLTGRQARLSHFHDQTASRAGLELTLDGDALPDRFAFEAIFSALQKTLSDLLQTPVDDLSVAFPYERPDNTQSFQLIFGDQVSFNAGRATFTLPQSMMNRPLPTSNPTLKALYDAECARLLADLSETSSCAEQTLQALEKLQGQYPQLEQMAAMLNVSARTYRRRLAAESTSFQALLDASRLKYAKQLLARGETVLGTALSLGFNDASNFRRAFSQWCGESPSRWQKQHRASGIQRAPESSSGRLTENPT